MALKVKAKEQLIKVGKYAATYRYVMMHGSTKRTDSASSASPLCSHSRVVLLPIEVTTFARAYGWSRTSATIFHVNIGLDAITASKQMVSTIQANGAEFGFDILFFHNVILLLFNEYFLPVADIQPFFNLRIGYTTAIQHQPIIIYHSFVITLHSADSCGLSPTLLVDECHSRGSYIGCVNVFFQFEIASLTVNGHRAVGIVQAVFATKVKYGIVAPCWDADWSEGAYKIDIVGSGIDSGIAHRYIQEYGVGKELDCSVTPLHNVWLACLHAGYRFKVERKYVIYVC